MEADFWRDKWSRRDIGFHADDANPLLVRHFDSLRQACRQAYSESAACGGSSSGEGGCVLLPLCGKTRDIAWLLAQGMHVAGVELVETAVQELFAELQLNPDVQQSGAHRRYRAELPNERTQTGCVRLEVLVGDFFALTPQQVQQVQQGDRINAVYDRAALVALPPAMRGQYAQQLMRLSDHAPQLVITYDYDQNALQGPPFAITAKEMEQHYAAQYSVQAVESLAVTGRLKEKAGGAEVQETLWLLQRQNT